LAEFIGVLLMIALAVVLVGAALALGIGLAPRRPLEAKREPFAGGVTGGDQGAAPRRRFAVRFYPMAILFVVLVAAMVFFLVWGAVLRELGVPGVGAMAAFSTPLAVGFVYAWGKGALRW